MKKAALLLLVIFMIGCSLMGKNVNPKDTASMENGTKIVNQSDQQVSIDDWTTFGRITIAPGDSLMMDGASTINNFNVPMSIGVQLYSLQKIFNESLELNKQFKDVNLIQPGDTVYLAPRYVGGTNEYWIADSAYKLGKHDCIWRICERYRNSELKTVPINIDLIPADKADQTDEAGVPWWAWFLLIAVVTFIVASALIIRSKESRAERLAFQRNPDNFPPVLPGGLSEDPREAARQISVISNTPENNLISVEERVIVLRPGYPVRDVMMIFGDGQPRPMPLTPGDRYMLATSRLADGSTQEDLYRRHCGNKVGPIIAQGQLSLQHDEDGKIILPEGYDAVKVSEYRPDSGTNSTNTAMQNGHAKEEPAAKPTEKSDWEKVLATKPQDNVEAVELITENFALVVHYKVAKKKEPVEA